MTFKTYHFVPIHSYKLKQKRLLDEEDEVELGYAPTFNVNNTSVGDVSMLSVNTTQ